MFEVVFLRVSYEKFYSRGEGRKYERKSGGKLEFDFFFVFIFLFNSN